MDLSIASILLIDGLSNGAIYALLGLATVLVFFTITRVIFIPQGEFVAFGALTLALLQNRQVPGTVWLLLMLAGLAALAGPRERPARRPWPAGRPEVHGHRAGLPLAISGVTFVVAPMGLPLVVQALLAIALVVPLGSLVYRLAYGPSPMPRCWCC